MQKSYLSLFKTLLLAIVVTLLSVHESHAQATYVPYSYQFDQKFDANVYSINNNFHSALKPYILDSTITHRYNELMQLGVDSNRKTWLMRKIFNEHGFDEKTSEYTFFADYLADLDVGRDFANKTTTYLNTRGYQLGGTVGTKFYFYTSGFENQAMFPDYYYNYVQDIRLVPGQAFDRDLTERKADWSYVTSIISYTPIKELNITLGEDKTFIGDGYRSLLLSDNAAPYPLLRLTATVGKLQYMVMLTNMEDKLLPEYDDYGNNRRKWAAFHYLDWSVSNRLSFGFFNAIIVAEANDTGQSHGFDFNYINPVLFASSLGPSTPYADNVFTGFTGKYKIFDKTAVYAQLLLDKFKLNDFFSGNSTDNTNGYQVGIRGADLFKVTGFNYLLEFNTVKPNTYNGQQTISNYTDYSQPLGDPLGNNFKELIGILNYSVGRFDFQGQLDFARCGADNTLALIYSQNVNQALDPTTITGPDAGPGIASKLYYAEGLVSYLINPKYNLRFELGGLFRDQTNALGASKTEMITFGLRSSFRSLYHDF